MRALHKSAPLAGLLILVLLLVPATMSLAGGVSNKAALSGLSQAKVVFDINLSTIKPLPLYLKVIKETHASLKAEGVKPEIVIAFRGKAVNFVTKAPGKENPEVMAQVAKQLKELKEMGVRVESCNVAMGLFKIKPGDVLAWVEVVGNNFVTLTGYQARGYGIIPVM